MHYPSFEPPLLRSVITHMYMTGITRQFRKRIDITLSKARLTRKASPT